MALLHLGWGDRFRHELDLLNYRFLVVLWLPRRCGPAMENVITYCEANMECQHCQQAIMYNSGDCFTGKLRRHQMLLVISRLPLGRCYDSLPYYYLLLNTSLLFKSSD